MCHQRHRIRFFFCFTEKLCAVLKIFIFLYFKRSLDLPNLSHHYEYQYMRQGAFLNISFERHSLKGGLRTGDSGPQNPGPKTYGPKTWDLGTLNFFVVLQNKTQKSKITQKLSYNAKDPFTYFNFHIFFSSKGLLLKFSGRFWVPLIFV